MKHFALIVLLCLLSGVSEGTFELEDPAKIVAEDEITLEDKIALEEEAQDKVWTVSAEKVIVPPGVTLFLPNIENNECVSFSKDASETKADGTSVSFTVKTYLGVIHDTTECPMDDIIADTPLKIALIEIDDDRLIWIDSSKVLKIKK